MEIGFSLITAASGKEKAVEKSVSEIQEVIELHPLFGEYDLIAKIQNDDFDSIGDIVINKIRPNKGIIDTKTLIGTRSLQGKTPGDTETKQKTSVT